MASGDKHYFAPIPSCVPACCASQVLIHYDAGAIPASLGADCPTNDDDRETASARMSRPRWGRGQGSIGRYQRPRFLCEFFQPNAFFKSFSPQLRFPKRKILSKLGFESRILVFFFEFKKQQPNDVFFCFEDKHRSIRYKKNTPRTQLCSGCWFPVLHLIFPPLCLKFRNTFGPDLTMANDNHFIF